MNKEFKIPSPFICFPFYTESDVIGGEDTNAPFYYDILYALGKEIEKPWEEKNKYLPSKFNNFKEVNLKLTELYQNRDRNSAKPIMIRMVAQFMDCVYWTNGLPIKDLENWENEVYGFTYLPVNLAERLAFILKEPDHFHSYNQLKSLYDEMEKIYYKSMI